MALRLLALLAVIVCGAGEVAYAGSESPRFVGPVLAIRKNTNANRVEYVVRVDGQCRPQGNEPVGAYFRHLTRGPNERRDLSFLERRAYGIQDQHVKRASTGGSVDFSLRALPGRKLRLEVRRAGDACRVRVLMRIAGQNAELLDVFLVLKGAIAVDHVQIRGRALSDSAELTERIEP